MVDVLLAHSYYLKFDAKQRQKMRPYPPLGTLYAAAILRQAGYSVALFDAMLSEGEYEFEQALERHRPRFVALYEDNFNFLTKMCLTRMRQAAREMGAAARSAGATVLVAGPDVSDHPEVYFESGAHYALLGDGEQSLRELLDALSGRSEMRPTEISGLAWPDPDHPHGVCRSPVRLPDQRLDAIPYPAWDLVNGEAYRTAWTGAHGYFSINMVSSRGCPFHCNWCAKPIWGERYAVRSPANVAEELAQVKRRFNPDHLWFTDDIFGLRPNWVADFAREVTARDAVVPFTIQSRVDLMTEKVVAALKLAGCAEVWMGAESGSQRVLDAMDKGTDAAQIGKARALLGAAGIKASFFIQFGYPGETFADIMATVQLVRDTLPDTIGVSVSYPLPGTGFYEMVREQLGAKTNWTDSNDLAMMFQGTYQSSFYRRLHSLLHLDLEVRQRLVKGLADAENLALLDSLNSAWMELGTVEAAERSLLPTAIVRQPGKLSLAPGEMEAGIA